MMSGYSHPAPGHARTRSYHHPATGLYPSPPIPPSFSPDDRKQAINDLDSYVLPLSYGMPSIFTTPEIALDQLTLTDNRGLCIKAYLNSIGAGEISFLEPDGTEEHPLRNDYISNQQMRRLKDNIKNYLLTTKIHDFLNPLVPSYIENMKIGRDNIHFTYNNHNTRELFTTSFSLEKGITINSIWGKKIHFPANKISQSTAVQIQHSTREVYETIEAFRNFLFNRNAFYNHFTDLYESDNSNAHINSNSIFLVDNKNQTAQFTLQHNNTITLDVFTNEKPYNIMLSEYIGQAESKEMAWRMELLFKKGVTILPNVYVPESYSSGASWRARVGNSSSPLGR